jgi:glycosyltransferase involved in cell wall biosynthesis
MKLTTIILTFNEEIHIERAINSVQCFSDRIIVVDSGSTDRTVELAKALGAEIKLNPFVTQAKQFNWALNQLSEDTEWIFRLDADEVVSPLLSKSIKSFLENEGHDYYGAVVNRRMTFLKKRIQYGGLFPVGVLRLFRYGYGKSEDRWMDEHIIVNGTVVNLEGELIDNNLNSLKWWIEKHNNYSSREVVAMLVEDFDLTYHADKNEFMAKQAKAKRKIKENIYYRIPVGLRAFIYFIYRFVIRLGFMDGSKGIAFHILQGFWYRYLVDLKLNEVKEFIKDNDVDTKTAILKVLGIKVDN